jgi:hypothetical protein
MARLVLKDASLTVNNIDLSAWVRSVTLVQGSFDTQDATAMGDDYKHELPTLGDCSIEAELWQDYAASAVDATLNGLVGSTTPFDVVVKATSSAAGATNPEYTMSGVLPEYTPIDGSVGDIATVKVKFANASGAGITRAIS